MFMEQNEASRSRKELILLADAPYIARTRHHEPHETGSHRAGGGMVAVQPGGGRSAPSGARAGALLSNSQAPLARRTQRKKNLTVAFRAGFEAPTGKKVLLRAAGSTLYRIFLNGEFIGHGPARGPHGWYRVHEIDLTAKLNSGANVVAFEVAGYNVNSFYLLDQPSFLQAEVVAGGEVLASTGGEDKPFAASLLPERVRKVQRYSFQRPFSEVYRLAPGFDRWRKDITVPLAPAKCALQPAKPLLPRRVPYSEFKVREPQLVVSTGQLKTGLKVEHPWKDRSLTGIGPQLGGFPESELTTVPSLELQTIANAGSQAVNQPYAPAQPFLLRAGAFQNRGLRRELDRLSRRHGSHAGARLASFLPLTKSSATGTWTSSASPASTSSLTNSSPAPYDVETFEPYTLRYLKLLALDGDCEVTGFASASMPAPSRRTRVSPPATRGSTGFSPPVWKRSARTLWMSSWIALPAKRAGWLCDSFFTARVAKDLTGRTLIEHNLFENFRLPDTFAHLPDGMVPMCYPSDHYDGVFIPNWALWFVVQLEEYLARSGDRETVQALEPRVMKLLDYFKRFRNSDGPLEKLESWVFDRVGPRPTISSRTSTTPPICFTPSSGGCRPHV